MPLEEYRAKRDFSATPEPTGGEPSADALSFVVQQHHATAMHYDFRLELDGVLMSWAIPKGPSYDTKDKRLAVHVEDHPLDYAGFEGAIPKGEYGGGTVIVWDRGWWEPVGDPHAAMAKGDFKFKLHGEKLEGGWVLVRLKPRPGEKRENWLLIKERDEHVRPREEYDVTVERPESVISGLLVDDVVQVDATEATQVADAKVAAVETTPKGPVSAQPVEAPLVAPPELALCTLTGDVPGGSGWLGEVKYDGYRLTVALADGLARCFSRNGEDVTNRFAAIAKAAESLPATSALLDGEAVVFDERGVSSFGALQVALSEGGSPITFVAFDLLYLNGFDVSALPLARRKDLLRALLADEPPTAPLKLAEYVEGGVDALFEVACAQGLEGVVAKRSDAPYPRGRTRSWLKIKCRRSQEFVIGGFTEAAGSRSGFGALLLGYWDTDRLVYAGRVGSGFAEKTLRDLAGQLTALEQPEPPFAEPPGRLKSPHWVEPRLVAQVAFAEWTSEGLLRQASFLGLRDDADPRSVTRETPTVGAASAEQVHVDAAGGSTDRAATGAGDVATVVAGVTITNPDKQLFPESDLTKLELARYYEAVAPLMLPEVAERPLTLVRCPVGGGAEASCFYQRHPDRGLPSSVGTLAHALAGHADADEWLHVSEVGGLVALAQMGVAEIHTWLSRADEPRRPDRIVLDLDPGPEVTWAQIVWATGIVRQAAEQLGFSAFLKNTGSKGLHVVLPVEPVWEFERIRVLARNLAEQVAAAHPDKLTSKMAKAVRTGRIFIDYVRNSEAASAVAAYSTRYLPGPTVAVPLAWDELDPESDIRRAFTPRHVIERVESGTDPWASLDDKAIGSRVLKSAEKALGGAEA